LEFEFFYSAFCLLTSAFSPNYIMITSTKNKKIVDLKKLTQRKHRRAQNRFMVEGLQLLAMALEGHFTPLDVFFCEDLFTGKHAPILLEQFIQAGAKTYPISPNIMQSLSERDSPQGLIATFPLFNNLFVNNNLLESLFTTIITKKNSIFILILDQLQDPGNLGTLIRTADAIAADAVILIEPCVDVFDPKTVRGSMGSIFTLPIISITNITELVTHLHQHQYNLSGADGYQGDIPWIPHAQALQGSTALFLGNEARGLSAEIRPHLTQWVRLPLLGKAESLNVAVAGGVLMYQWLQKNREWRMENGELTEDKGLMAKDKGPVTNG
jgi:TrmH family RNA methyltransferase